MLFQSYFSMVFKPIHPAKLVTTSLFSRSRVEPIAVGPKNHPEIGQHFRYIYFFSYVTVMIFPYQWIAGKIDTGNPSNFPKNLDLIFLFPRSRAISWPCQSAVEDTPERSVALFRVGHFKAWRTVLTWPWPLGVWTCVFSMNLGVYIICYAICNIYIYVILLYT